MVRTSSLAKGKSRGLTQSISLPNMRRMHTQTVPSSPLSSSLPLPSPTYPRTNPPKRQPQKRLSIRDAKTALAAQPQLPELDPVQRTAPQIDPATSTPDIMAAAHTLAVIVAATCPLKTSPLPVLPCKPAAKIQPGIVKSVNSECWAHSRLLSRD